MPLTFGDLLLPHLADLAGVFCTSGSEREFYSGGTLVCRRIGITRVRYWGISPAVLLSFDDRRNDNDLRRNLNNLLDLCNPQEAQLVNQIANLIY